MASLQHENERALLQRTFRYLAAAVDFCAPVFVTSLRKALKFRDGSGVECLEQEPGSALCFVNPVFNQHYGRRQSASLLRTKPRRRSPLRADMWPAVQSTP